ncbi:MAG: DUF4384 domain-containing protein [Bryobacteraceae bacterium]|nr:DUF4384 domain-containing protein [Bryobacteraceae bacterium]
MRTSLPLVIFLAVPCMAQEQAGAKALFVDPTSGVTIQGGAPATPPVRATTTRPRAGAAQARSGPVKEGTVTGLRYWIELQTEQGQLLRVNSSRVFRSGERIRLHVESNVDGSLVILQSQDNGPFSRLFPTASNPAGRVTKYQDQAFPSKAGWFRFDSKPGDIRLMLMVQADPSGSSAPVSVAANQPRQSAGQAGPTGDSQPITEARPDRESAEQIEARMRAQMASQKGSKALVVEEDGESSTVVVDTRRASEVPPGAVAVEIRLSHR